MKSHIKHVVGSLAEKLPTGEAVSASLLDPRGHKSKRGIAQVLMGKPLAIPQFWFNRIPNFGDTLAPAITESVSGYAARYTSNRVRGKLLGVGSIAKFARPGDSLWGTGALDESGADLSRCQVLAVRGPLTREVCTGEIPEIFGDPAILLPLIHTPVTRRRYPVGVIPHYVEHQFFPTQDPQVKFIDVTSPDWRRTVDEICSCDVVLSSSLHGIIVAEAYDVPAVWVSASDRVLGQGFKFRDYYASTNRETSGPRDWELGLSRNVECAGAPSGIDPQPLLNAWPKRWTASEDGARPR